MPPLTFARGHFPNTRFRRSRQAEFSRRLVREHQLSRSDLIAPLFVCEGRQEKQAIEAMPGQFRFSIEKLLAEVESLAEVGITAIALFPVIDQNIKDNQGSYAFNEQGLMQRAIAAVKKEFPDIGLIADVALDPYTSHGQDGVLDENGSVANDATIKLLCQQALSLAGSGADVIAPSDMMDGRIGAIRTVLEQEQFSQTLIMSYAAKFASCYYGPFRDAVGSGTQLGQGSKACYQMDPANGQEALHEVAQDLQEGADWVMVKPGMPYLDVLHSIKTTFQCPTLAYQVSGEYSMLALACQAQLLERDQAILESLLAFKRAGADAIFSYFAKDAAKLL